MFSKELIETMDIKAIRQLFKKLKKDRVVLTYEEFSERLGYNRTYISRVLNGHEPLTPEIIEKIKSTDFYATKNVSRETITLEDGNTIAGFLKVIQQHTEIILNQSQTIKNLTEPPNLGNAKNA